jgi:hypothetical protein
MSSSFRVHTFEKYLKDNARPIATRVQVLSWSEQECFFWVKYRVFETEGSI